LAIDDLRFEEIQNGRHDARVNRFLLSFILLGFCLNVARASSIDERIWINAKINGQPVRFAYDTGWGNNQTLFSTTAKRLGLKVTPPDQKPALAKLCSERPNCAIWILE
jgi:hypothetical protein